MIKATEEEIKRKVAVSRQTCLLTTLGIFHKEEDHHHLDLNIDHLDLNLNLKDLEDLEDRDMDLVDQEEDHLILMDQEDWED